MEDEALQRMRPKDSDDEPMAPLPLSNQSRDELVSHVYDITHGAVNPEDHLVAIDDSIVRGTTLKQSKK